MSNGLFFVCFMVIFNQIKKKTSRLNYSYIYPIKKTRYDIYAKSIFISCENGLNKNIWETIVYLKFL